MDDQTPITFNESDFPEPVPGELILVRISFSEGESTKHRYTQGVGFSGKNTSTGKGTWFLGSDGPDHLFGEKITGWRWLEVRT